MEKSISYREHLELMASRMVVPCNRIVDDLDDIRDFSVVTLAKEAAWITTDGRVFDTQEDAIKYQFEYLLRRARENENI